MDSLTAVWDSCFNLDSPLVFFPVRHHSPACSHHLKATLEAYRPDCILIEGPWDTNHLMEHIGSPDNQAPLCIYYSYTHKTKEDDGEAVERRHACYYPLLDFSPELCAIRYGAAEGVETRFIDLPYSELSLLGGSEKGQDEGKNAYYDDYYLSRSRFIARLCEKEGCRHYGELWEKLFELHGLSMDTPKFVRSMLALCHYSRVEEPEEMLREEGCLAREAHMAAEIQGAAKMFSRILVITGGFHTAALQGLVQGDIVKHKARAGKAESYLIPYSFAESDQLAGYASGMPYPAFYQAVSERMRTDVSTAYSDTVLEYLALIGGALRRKKESTSIADEVAANLQAEGLRALRDKPQQGVYELLDSVESVYIKGERSLANSSMMGTAVSLLRGDRMGEVRSGAGLVPLLADFQLQAKALRLKTGLTSREQITLELLNKPSHRRASTFFHRLTFLGVPFAQRKSGPDYRNRDTARVRETWSYAFGARVEAAVIDVSYLGGTLREAASTALNRAREEQTGAGKLSRLLIDAAVMDLTGHTGPLIRDVQGAIAEDGSFPSLIEAAQNLLFLQGAKWLLDTGEDRTLPELLREVFLKAVALLPSLDTGVEEEDRSLAAALKDLNQIAARKGEDAALLTEALGDLCGRSAPLPPPCLEGAARGILYANGAATAEAVLAAANTFFYGSGERMQRSGRFLGGLFQTAWDILLREDGFLIGLGNVLEMLEQPEFLALLPDLRLAFSSFPPSQIDRIAEKVQHLLGLERDLLSASATPEALFALGQKLDSYASRILTEGGNAS